MLEVSVPLPVGILSKAQFDILGPFVSVMLFFRHVYIAASYLGRSPPSDLRPIRHTR